MCQIHEYRKKTSNIKSIYNFAIQLLPISLDVPYQTTKQSNQFSSRKDVKSKCQYRKSSFNELVNPDKLVSIHYKNIKYLLTEIYKVGLSINKMVFSPPIMSDFSSLNENNSYNLRSGATVNRQDLTVSKFGVETVSEIGTILWNNLPTELKCREFEHF